MRILFLCTGNSCRSQMAEGLARSAAPNGVAVHSAGTNPVGIHPLAAEVMAERGTPLDGHSSKSLAEVPDSFDLVVTLCGDAAETCPTFPGAEVIHWPMRQPGCGVRLIQRSMKREVSIHTMTATPNAST